MRQQQAYPNVARSPSLYWLRSLLVNDLTRLSTGALHEHFCREPCTARARGARQGCS